MLSYPLYLTIREQQQVFTDVIAWGSRSFDTAQGGVQRPAQALWVSGNFFPVLGVRPAAGRLLAPADDVTGCAPGRGAGACVLAARVRRRPVGDRPHADARRPAFDIVGVTRPSSSASKSAARSTWPCRSAPSRSSAASDSGLEKADVWFLGGAGPAEARRDRRAGRARSSRRCPRASSRETVPPRYRAEDAKNYLEIKLGARFASGAGVSAAPRTTSDRWHPARRRPAWCCSSPARISRT